MVNGENLRDKIVKHFFNITGDFDEYKRQEVNRIGTNAFFMCLPVLLLGPVVALLWQTQSAYMALIGLAGFDVAFITIVICPYLMVASRRAHLTDHEVSVQDLPAARKHILWVSLGLAIYFAVFMYLEQAFLGTFFDGRLFTQELVSFANITGAIVSGIFFGIIMGLTYWLRLKKQQ